MSKPDLSVNLAPRNKRGLSLPNPVMTASGTFGYGTEYAELMDTRKLGAIVCKGTTLQPRSGNPQPRLVETASGVLNSIGMENIGLDALIREKAPIWAKWEVPVIVNILGFSIEEYSEIARRLTDVHGIGGIEVNVSCPNVSQGGLEFGASPKAAADVTRAVRSATSLPVLVKLSPNVSDPVQVAKAVAGAGADALTLANTLWGTAIDLESRKPVFSNVVGGLSGPAIKPIALYMVYQVAGEVKVPLIGCGGIASARDALEFILAGATAVQVGSATFANPLAPIEVLEGIEQYLERESVPRISDLIGAAL